MSTISTAAAWALAFVALLLPPPAAAQDEASTALTVRVAPGVTAEVTGIGGATATVRLSPGGTTQRLTVAAGDGDGHSHAESADFNFDGVQDLAFVATVGQVNDSYQVFLFDAATRRRPCSIRPMAPDRSRWR
jgi:endonuclease YncB( thermonuclease family)